MDLCSCITALQERELTTGEILMILLFVAEYRQYTFTCCHRRAFVIMRCPVTLEYNIT
jgi:hypothetical protein